MRTSSGFKSVHQHLNSFAILAGLVLLTVTWPAEAEIVYTPANINIGENGSYNLDLNNDGVTDFVISTNQSQVTCALGHTGLYDTVTETPASGNGAEGSSPAKLTDGKQIGPAQTFYGGTGTLAWLQSCQFLTGGDNWIDEQYCGYDCYHPKGLKGYLGLVFQIDGETHYGWALLSVKVSAPKSAATVTLTGYAYETTPAVPIKAGQKE